MNLSWFANILVHHPFIVLSVVAVFSGTCIIIPFTLNSMTFPNFQDPQMGFSTRGTVISNRLISWSNLIKATKPAGELAPNPKEFLESQNRNSLPSHKTFHKKGKKKKLKNEPVYGSVYVNATRSLSDTKNDLKRWRELKMLNPHSRRNFNEKRNEDFFCGNPDEKYAHMVVTANNDDDLFTLANMLTMCRLEHQFMGLKYYDELCIQNTKYPNKCCRPWSVPNYIAMLNNRFSCLSITEEDIEATKKFLKRCAPYFHSLELTPDCLKTTPYCGVPLECMRHDAIYNMMFFMLSTSFLPANNTDEDTPLMEAMIFLPLACSTAILPYYHEVEKFDLEYEGLKVVAMDFGIKSALFDECLILDTWFMGTGALFVFICMWLYTQSLFLTTMTIIVIVFSLAISYFMYVLIFEINFFPFMNLLTIVVAIGIGSDDAFIFCKIWHIQKGDNENSLFKIMTDTFQHAFITMFVTALTTTVAFLGSYVSCVTAISCFSVFAGTAVIINYVLMMTWFPACIIIWESTCLSKSTMFRSCLMACFQRWCCFKPQWNLSTQWFHFPRLARIWRAKEDWLLNIIVRFKYFWFTLLMTIAIISTVIVLVYPKLQLPNTPEFQLFATSHPFEQYDFNFKKRFWFRRPDRGTEETTFKLPLRFVWGILPIDNGDHLNPVDFGTLTLDPTFDMSDSRAQEWLKDFCQRVRLQSFYQSTMGPLLQNCFVETFVKSMKRKCFDVIENRNRTPCCGMSEFPFERNVFDKCIIEEMGEIYGTPRDFLNPGMAGPKFSKDQFPTIKAVVIEYDSNYSFSMSYEQMHEFYTVVEEWMTDELKTAPESMKNGWFISDLEFYDLQRELSQSTEIAVGMSMGLALIVLFLSTLNILISIYAIITITSSIFVTMAILVLLGWKLNVLESVAVSTAIGLTVDFSLHYSVNYRLCPEDIAVNRERATKHALSYMAGPALMTAITTGAAGAFMIPSSILPYIQIGIFLLIVMCVSWVYATFFLGSMLAIAGPLRNCGQVNYSNISLCPIKSKRVRDENDPQPCSLPDCHELESLTLPKRERQTPKPLRRSLSSGGARFTPSKYMFSDQSPSASSAITIIMNDDN